MIYDDGGDGMIERWKDVEMEDGVNLLKMEMGVGWLAGGVVGGRSGGGDVLRQLR